MVSYPEPWQTQRANLYLQDNKDYCRIDRGKLFLSRRGKFNEPRNIAIYLTRRMSDNSLKQIGVHFKLKKYSSVSCIIERTNQAIAMDQKLRNRVEKLISVLSKSQEQT